MTAQLVLIAAILVLGGAVATVGDRLGMRIGKARLSLFRLRPRQTATLITILTGSIISASTFGILFALSEQLRRGVFDYESTQKNLYNARRELDSVTRNKQQTENERDRAVAQQRVAQRRLNRTNQSLQGAIARQQRTETQLNRSQSQLSRTQAQLNQIQGNYQQAQTLLQTVSQQAMKLRSEISQLQTERQVLIQQQEQVQAQIAQRNQEIAERDRLIAERDQAIAEREISLRNLENQRTLLVQEVQDRERELQGLREGNVAVLRNQRLAAGVVRVVSPDAAPQAVAQLLRQANQLALERILPGVDVDDSPFVLGITNTEVEQLTNQIQNGQDYVVQILARGNYFVGEPCVLAGQQNCVLVYVSAAPNQVVFAAREVVAATTAEPAMMNTEALIERIRLLIAAAQFRARQVNVIGDTIQVADGRSETIVAFLNKIKEYNQPVDIQAIAADITYTAGPLQIELQAVQNGQVLFGTE
jgi:uncharacterized protein (DUF3084 family)